MSDKAALRGRWGATNHDFDFRKYNTFAEQIHKEQEAQFKAARILAGETARGPQNPYGHKVNGGGATDVDWGRAAAKQRSLPISGVPKARFHNRGTGGAKRTWGSEPEPLTSAEIGGWWHQKEIYKDLDYDGLKDADEAAGTASLAAIKAHAAGAQLPAAVGDDLPDDDALLRAVNGRRDKWGEEMYTVVNLQDTGYML